MQTSPALRALCRSVPRAALPPPRALPSRSAASPCGRTRGPPSRAPAPPLLSAPAALRTRRSHGSILNNRALSFARPIVLLREKGAREAWGGVALRDGGGDFTHARTRAAPPAPPPARGGRGPIPASSRRGGASAPLPARPRSAAREPWGAASVAVCLQMPGDCGPFPPSVICKRGHRGAFLAAVQAYLRDRCVFVV